MIIFDANVVYGLNRNSPRFDLLRALKQSGEHPAGIPWMVREELVAKQVLDYSAAHEGARAAVNGLNRRIHWSNRTGDIPALEIDDAKEYWRNQYAEILETLETSSDNAKQALAREAFCEKPAKTTPKDKGGARDVAIWLSVIDYLKENPEDEVFFVSNNTDDFGDGTKYPEPMSEDLGEMKSRLTILTSFDEFISRFTVKVEADDEHVKELLGELASDSLTSFASTANLVLRDGRFEGTRIGNGAFEAVQWSAWLLPPSAVIRNVSRSSGHKIGNAEWYTANVNWILVGIAQPAASLYRSDISGILQLACEWPTRVLFSVGENRQLTILEQQRPKALDPNERADLQPLLEKAVTASQIASSMFASFVDRLLRENFGLGPTPNIEFDPTETSFDTFYPIHAGFDVTLGPVETGQPAEDNHDLPAPPPSSS
jgi:hypothetical protein